jgi:hypothetical protein
MEGRDRRARREVRDNRKSGIVTSAMPRKNIGRGTNCRPGIQRDSTDEMSAENAGISRKNIVT